MNTLIRFTTPRPVDEQIIIAHRGLSWTYPENTLVSYRAAADAGADLIELDFHVTADGVAICVHDEVLDRYLGSSATPQLRQRPISTLNWEELSQADVGRWQGEEFEGTRVPRLSEVLEEFVGKGHPTLLIEQKGGSPEQILTLLRQFDAVTKVIVQSFDWQFLTRLHHLEPRLLLAALGRTFTPATVAEVKSTGVQILHWGNTIRRRDVSDAHAAGLPVWVFKPNTELAWRGAQALGVDGVTTDRCNFMYELLHSPK